MKDRSPHILPLQDALDIGRVGGKAINLAKLMQAGLPVPGGFVVTTSAFRDATDGKVSRELANEIREALMPFEGKLMAARSSATAEDMADASMAGQYDTFLNLETGVQIADAVEKCWRSIRSSRTEAYLAEHGIDLDEVAMAVVVQQQVSADVAGVLFTVDPHTGSRDVMLVEAAWGLGETLVSGDVHPDVIRVSAAEDKVISYDVAEKKVAIYPGGSGIEPVTMRILKASMVPLALILGLMIMVFMWFPARVDPASWNAEPGRMVSIVAEIDGDCLEPFRYRLPSRLDWIQSPCKPFLRSGRNSKSFAKSGRRPAICRSFLGKYRLRPTTRAWRWSRA